MLRYRIERISFLFAFLLTVMLAGQANGQQMVDKTVAVISDGSRSELITYSDLLWQLALQDNAPPLDPPRSSDLNQALKTQIDQRLFALEARRVPRMPTEKEVSEEIAAILEHFTPPVFQARLRQVGFETVSDPAFKDLIIQRLAIRKYVDFRFASFVVITADDEARYYRDVYVPEFRRSTPGLLVPSLEDRRSYIRGLLTTQKIAASVETFLDQAKRRVNIEILSEV